MGVTFSGICIEGTKTVSTFESVEIEQIL